MPTANPLLLEKKALRLAFWIRSRSNPVEAAFGLGFLIVLTGIAALILATLARLHADEALEFLGAHRLPVVLVCWLGELWVALALCRKHLSLWRSGWLAPYLLPADETSALANQLLALVIRQMAGIICLAGFGWWARPSPIWINTGLGLGVAVAAGAAAAGMLTIRSRITRRPARARPAKRSSRTIALKPTRASLGSWQWAGLRAAWRSRASAAALAPGLLLIPGGEAMLTTLALLAIAACFAAGLASWAQAMNRLLVAAAWLRPQPLSAAQLIRPLLVPPTIIIVCLSLVAASCLIVLGTPPVVSLLLASGMPALALLHGACVAAFRYQAARITAWFIAQTLLLMALGQDYPPLTPVLWVLFMTMLMLKAARA
ncbi:MAG: hypothetical protein JWQ90_2673 [Hydrocarboniphaga sp.]|uniref:hypothetical protein n=1 Tax=Hydrocarboniphaga sp. TaxID=2033016 RepID=UPI00262594E6|nr:hypothetical protein [Hydrocarboniphaga sp.]MDB5970223.1 hypothetical protein [Hydrocarboniphaga sp.]